MRLHIRDEERWTGRVCGDVGKSANVRRFPGLGQGCGRLFEQRLVGGGNEWVSGRMVRNAGGKMRNTTKRECETEFMNESLNEFSQRDFVLTDCY